MVTVSLTKVEPPLSSEKSNNNTGFSLEGMSHDGGPLSSEQASDMHKSLTAIPLFSGRIPAPQEQATLLRMSAVVSVALQQSGHGDEAEELLELSGQFADQPVRYGDELWLDLRDKYIGLATQDNSEPNRYPGADEDAAGGR